MLRILLLQLVQQPSNVVPPMAPPLHRTRTRGRVGTRGWKEHERTVQGLPSLAAGMLDGGARPQPCPGEHLQPGYKPAAAGVLRQPLHARPLPPRILQQLLLRAWCTGSGRGPS